MKLRIESHKNKEGAPSTSLRGVFTLVMGLLVGFQLRGVATSLDPNYATNGLRCDNNGGSSIQDSSAPGTQRRRTRETIPLEELTKSAAANLLECPDPLLPITDKINRTIPPLVRYNIPHRIHLSWKQRCVPEDFVTAANEWKNNFPDWSFYYHDDEAVDRLLQQDWPEFPDLQQVMEACIPYGGAVKQDIWRLLALYEYGGFYSDIDVTPGGKLTQDFMDNEANQYNVSAFFLTDSVNRPSQWLFAMAPRHPIAYFTMRELLNTVLTLKNVQDFKPVWTTGPEALRKGYDAYFRLDATREEEYKRLKVMNAGLYEGPDGLRIRKYGGSWGPDAFISLTMKGEKVPFNGGTLTRKQRAEAVMGEIHWTRAVNRKKRQVPQTSCGGMLYKNDVDVASHLK